MEEENKIQYVACTCPTCSKKMKVKHPGKPGKYKYTCKECNNQFVLKFDAPAQPEDSVLLDPPRTDETTQTEKKKTDEPLTSIVPKDIQDYLTIGGLLEHHRGFFGKDKTHPLREGKQLVGRKNDTSPSDIMIDDSTMSRQSIEIDVVKNPSPFGSWYSYVLTVKKTLNPVTHNGEELSVGESINLHINDTITLGKTKFTLK